MFCFFRIGAIWALLYVFHAAACFIGLPYVVEYRDSREVGGYVVVSLMTDNVVEKREVNCICMNVKIHCKRPTWRFLAPRYGI